MATILSCLAVFMSVHFQRVPTRRVACERYLPVTDCKIESGTPRDVNSRLVNGQKRMQAAEYQNTVARPKSALSVDFP